MRILLFIAGAILVVAAVIGIVSDKPDLVVVGGAGCLACWTVATNMPKKTKDLICRNCGKEWEKSQIPATGRDTSNQPTWMCPDCGEVQPRDNPPENKA